MSGSFRNIIRIGDTSGHEPPGKKILSIGLRPDGFVFATLETPDLRYTTLEDYEYTPGHSGEDYLQNLANFTHDHAVFSTPYEKVNISLFTPNLLLIPAELYQENHKELLCKFCSVNPENHTVRAEKLNTLNAFGVYLISDDLKNFFDNRFESYRLWHQGTALIESILADKQLENRQMDVVLHVKRSFFEIVLLENKRVILYQSFDYLVFDDLLYYLFYVLEQFERDAAKQKLLLIGEIGLDCDSFQILSSLFYQVSFPERNNVCRYAEPFDQIPGHYYYNLINLVTCG